MSTSNDERLPLNAPPEEEVSLDDSDDSSGTLSSTDSEGELDSEEEIPIVHVRETNPERLLKIHDRWHAPYQNIDFIRPDFRIRERFASRRKGNFHLDADSEYLKHYEEEPDAGTVEYEIDHEDLSFLCRLNKTRGKRGHSALSDRKFEEVMDALEKSCHFQCTDTTKQFDQSSACCVCREGEADQQNQIIFCDMCNIAVHQDCYGVPYVPEGQWFCRRCQISPSVAVPCVACMQSTGALKRTTCGRWAHVVCTIWVNELHFGNTAFMEPIENVEIALKNRRALRCIVCNKRGACLQCSKKQCSHAFHVTCAIFAGFEMRINESAEGVEANVYSHFIFCPFHSFCGSGHGHKKHKIKDMVNIDQRILNEKAVTSIPVVTPRKIEEISKRLRMDKMDDIVSYWFQKRKAHGGIPLIRRLQVGMTGCRFEDARKTQQEVDDPNNDRLSYMKEPSLEREEPLPGPSGLGSMSNCSSPPVLYPENIPSLSLSASPSTSSSPSVIEEPDPTVGLRAMLSMVMRREKLKRTRINLRREFFEKSFGFLRSTMSEILDALAEKDYNSIFALPVREEDVPGYHRIIKHPMDLSKMRKKVEDDKYHGISDLKADFVLMMDNCKAFNKENAFFLDYGNKFRTAGFKIIRQAEKRVDDRAKVVMEVLDSAKHVKVEAMEEDLEDLDMDKPPVIEKEELEKPPEVKKPKMDKPPELKKEKHHEVRKDKHSDVKKGKPPEVKKEKLPEVKKEKPPEVKKTKKPNFPASTSKVPRDKPREKAPEDMPFLRCQNYEAISFTSTNDRESESPPLLEYADEPFRPQEVLGSDCSTSDENEDLLQADDEAWNEQSPERSPEMDESLLESEDQFLHDDIVWVDGVQSPGRVVDYRLRAMFSNGDISVSSIMDEKPKNDHRHENSLVFFFDKHNSWGWFPTHELRHCDIVKEAENDTSDMALESAKRYWENSNL